MPIGELCLVAMRDVFTCKKMKKIFFHRAKKPKLEMDFTLEKSHRSAIGKPCMDFNSHINQMVIDAKSWATIFALSNNSASIEKKN